MSAMLVLSEAPYYAKFTLLFFSINNMCLYPVSDLPRKIWKSVLGDVTTESCLKLHVWKPEALKASASISLIPKSFPCDSK